MCYSSGDVLIPSFLLHLLFGILLQGRVVPFLHYLFSHLYSMDSWIFFPLGCNSILYNLLLKFFQLWSIGTDVLLTCPFFGVGGSSFTFWCYKMLVSSSIFPTPALASSVSARSPGFFYWGKIFGNQDLVSEWTGCTHCRWGLLLLGPLREQS